MSDIIVPVLVMTNIMTLIALFGCIYAIHQMIKTVGMLVQGGVQNNEMWKAQANYNLTLKAMIKDLQQEVVKQTIDL